LYAALFNPLKLWRREHFEMPVVIEHTLLGTSILVNEPTLIKQVLLEKAANYGRDTMQQRVLRRMTGRSLFLAEQEDWRIQRKVLGPFFSAGALSSYLHGMSQAAEDAVRHLQKSESFDLGAEMSALTVDVLSRTLFAPGFCEPSAGVAYGVRRYTDVNGPLELGDLLRLPPWMPGVRRILGWRATTTVKRRSRRLIADAMVSGYAPDSNIIAAMLVARDPETGNALDAAVIQGNVSTLIGAGSDTVAVALHWAIFLLSQTPEILAEVEAEVDAQLGTGPLTLEKLELLVWTRAVIEETMRLYPPTPVMGRMALRKDRLGVIDVPAGTTILISPWVMHRHTKLWSDADLFVPERFFARPTRKGSPFCLPALWRRTTHMPGHGVCDAGGGDSACHPGPQFAF
jgi:cytochrome P450